MINIKKILLGVSFISSISLAQGLEGYLGIAAGHYEVQDNFDDHSNNHTLYSLDTKPKIYDRYLALPSMDLNYYGFYFKTQLEGNFGVQAGYSWAKDSSVFVLLDGFGIEQAFKDAFSFKLKQTKKNMYTNPYTINSNRNTKKATINSLEVKAEGVMKFLEVEYKYENIDIDDKVNNDAKQSGDKHELSSMAYVIPFSDSIYGGLGLYGGFGNFDGDSNDYTKFGYKYAIQGQIGDHQLQLEVSTAKYDFDSSNSYFNRTRDEEEDSIMLFYMKQKFLGVQKLFLNFIFVKQSVDSNIDFFDKDMEVVLFNVGYGF